MNLVLRFECNNDDYVFNVIFSGLWRVCRKAHSSYCAVCLKSCCTVYYGISLHRQRIPIGLMRGFLWGGKEYPPLPPSSRKQTSSSNARVKFGAPTIAETKIPHVTFKMWSQKICILKCLQCLWYYALWSPDWVFFPRSQRGERTKQMFLRDIM
jgi:hypothetical protein